MKQGFHTLRGPLIAYKKLAFDCVARLIVPPGTRVYAHAPELFMGTVRMQKLRAQKAMTVLIIDRHGRKCAQGWSLYDRDFCYEPGQYAIPNMWKEREWTTDDYGIHCFASEVEAEAYTLQN